MNRRHRPPPGEFFSETNDNSLCGHPAELLQASCLVADAEVEEEKYMASGSYTRPLAVVNVPKLHTL
jgi:hypothetical protein